MDFTIKFLDILQAIKWTQNNNSVNWLPVINCEYNWNQALILNYDNFKFESNQ